MDYQKAFFSLLLGIAVITILYVLGAYFARNRNFKLKQFVDISWVVYFTTAFYSTKNYPLLVLIVLNLLIAVYESTLARTLAVKINSQDNFIEEPDYPIISDKSVLTHIILAVIATIIGWLTSRI